MGDYRFWKVLFQNNKLPCYVRDIESEQILYANQEFYRFFDCGDEIIGRKFSEIVILDKEAIENIRNHLKPGGEYEYNFFHKSSKQALRGKGIVLQSGSEVFAEFEVLLPQENDFDVAMSRCLSILKLPEEEITHSLMELLCEYYSCESAFVNGVDEKNSQIQIEFQWSSDTSVNEEVVDLVEEHKLLLLDWIKERNEIGIIEADIEKENNSPVGQQILLDFDKKNVTVSTIEDNEGHITGIVGMNNRASGKYDYRLLNLVNSFVAQGVNKTKMEKTLSEIKNIDSLTELFNREEYAKQMDLWKSTPPKSLGVVSVNVNGLKYVNDSIGISGGDVLIKNSAARLKEHFNFPFFRMSGDEFIGIAPEILEFSFESAVLSLHDKLRKEENFDFALGHAFGEGRFEISTLLHNAETMMYINKQEYYSKSNRSFDSVDDAILSDLLSYLADEEFMVYLQPQVRLVDGSLYGAEALIRRFDKKKEKMVFPDQFIPLYEQKSIIRHVDMFVVEEICKLLAKWKGKEIPISVNLSRVTLQEYGIVDSIVKICDQYQVPHHLLVIEVTERVGLIENNVASELIRQFKDNGFNISLDDFGCAYSNIVTLAQIRVDEVKIDKSLVDNLTTNKSNHILVKNVLTMCNELDGASTLAEGIEDEEQATLLHQLGCHLGQGYFYARPQTQMREVALMQSAGCGGSCLYLFNFPHCTTVIHLIIMYHNVPFESENRNTRCIAVNSEIS